MSTFGDLERAFADLYPYRWAFAAGLFVFLAAATAEPPAAAEPVVLKSGQFQDIDGFHKGTGTATIYEGSDGSRLLRLEDFKVTNGPELHVVLSPYGGPEEVGGRLKSPGWIDLGKLKGNIGNQNYVIPDDVDIGIHNSVTIWCKPFDVIFSVAVLQDAT